MIKKDYVNQNNTIKINHKKKINYNKSLEFKLIILMIIILSLLLCFSSINKYYKNKNKLPIAYQQKNNNYKIHNIPPLPKERWKYIKELENYNYKTENIKNN